MRPMVSRSASLTDPAWIYELKLDGFRLLADVPGGRSPSGRAADVRGREVMLRYRSGIDCSHVFPELVELLGRLRGPRLVLDGEVVAFDEAGRPDFDRLGPRLRKTRDPKPPVSFHVFDVLAVGDLDVRPLPLVHRKTLVERVVERSKGILRAVPFVVGDGRELAAFVMKHELEGIVAKHASSPYVGGESPSWIKIKRWEEEEFVLTRVRRDRLGDIDAAEIATRSGSELVPAGVVDLGLWRLEDTLERNGRRGWTEAPADLVVTVTFTGRSSAGRLRTAVIKGVRSGT
jgi:bifunctional non-homologous end joining protein LigD